MRHEFVIIAAINRIFHKDRLKGVKPLPLPLKPHQKVIVALAITLITLFKILLAIVIVFGMFLLGAAKIASSFHVKSGRAMR